MGSGPAKMEHDAQNDAGHGSAVFTRLEEVSTSLTFQAESVVRQLSKEIDNRMAYIDIDNTFQTNKFDQVVHKAQVLLDERTHQSVLKGNHDAAVSARCQVLTVSTSLTLPL